MEIKDRRIEEKNVIRLMIHLYYKKHPSVDISENRITQYCHDKIDKCPMMKSKTFCSECKVHCYNDVMREHIRMIMRFSGPRMIFYHPILAMKHLYYQLKK